MLQKSKVVLTYVYLWMGVCICLMTVIETYRIDNEDD